jgi:hypothetical protein
MIIMQITMSVDDEPKTRAEPGSCPMMGFSIEALNLQILLPEEECFILCIKKLAVLCKTPHVSINTH